MFGLRSVLSRAVAAGLALALVVVSGIALTAWRTQEQGHQLDKLERSSVAAIGLEHARAQLYLQISLLSGLAFSQDPSLAEDFHQAQLAFEEDLSRARADAVAGGDADQLAMLDDLTARKARFEETVNLAIPLLLQMDPTGAAQMAATYLPEMWNTIDAMRVDLDLLDENEHEQLAADRAAAGRAADATLWLVVGLGVVGFLIAAGAAGVVVQSVVRPLAALRLSARAIAAGNLNARAKVFGPEEVASLAYDFNRMTDALAAKTEEYITTTNLTGDMIAKVDSQGKWTFLNDAACQFLGKPRERLLGTVALTYVHSEDVERTRQTVEGAGTRKEPLAGFVNRMVTPMGTRVVEWNAHPLLDERGESAGIQMTGRDVTERRQMEEALRQSELRYRLLTENTADIVWTMDLSLKYTYISPAVTRMRGYTVEEMMGLSGKESMTPASFQVAMQMLAEQLALERVEGTDPNRSTKAELEMYCKGGSTVWTEMNMTFVRDADGRPTGILGVTRNISERKRAEEERERLNAELEKRAITDSLTGLYNHAHFYERLAEEVERSKRYGHRFALVMMDVDAFKHYNDSRGHQAGDEALHLVAQCIRSVMRRSDAAFRYGGDEFVAILLNADASRAQTIVNRINGRIASKLKEMDDPAAAWLGLSAGVACFPDDATTVDDIVMRADTAMYDAKRLAWARGVMGRGPAAGSAILAADGLHETQTGVFSGAARSLAAALEDLTTPEALAKKDLRTIAALGAAAEIKDPYIRGHQERTSRLATALAEEMGLSPDRVRNVTTAGLVHDLGKVNVGESILNKPGKLTESEFAKMKEHPALGAAMIGSGAEALRPIAPIVRHHHERFDGTGYPDGLARDNIPLEARILSVVDAFDAMTHERAYRKALSSAEALGEIQQGAGTRFDQAVVEAFLGVVRRRGGALW